MNREYIYKAGRLKQTIKIDSNWDKTPWQNIQSIELNNYMGELPGFRPSVQVKMMYDNENLYLIFQVHDCYVQCLTSEINGPVYTDACVEFFFAPDIAFPERYFNLEINCGGTALMHYNIIARKEFKTVEPEDIRQIEIAHSLPGIVDPEISEPITWTVEYRIPFAMLEKYSKIKHPENGVNWKVNFYKIAEKGSNIHFLTWTKVAKAKPDFHLPEFFGTLEFE